MKECEFFVVSEEGNFTCKKIPKYNRITREICKEHCPVYEKKCKHLAFSLRKEEVFSALGLGGRRIEIRVEHAVCNLLKEEIFDIKKCSTCPHFSEKLKIETKGEDIIKLGIRALIASLGEEKTREFLENIRGVKKKPSNGLEREIDNWLSM